MKRILTMLIFATAMVATPALAVDLKAPITQVDGKPFEGSDGKPTVTTLGSIAKVALLATYPDDQTATGQQKFDRWKLASKIEAGDGNLSVEEIKLLKDLIGKSYGPPVVGPAWKLLDPGAAK
jgi:hypothetical protein